MNQTTKIMKKLIILAFAIPGFIFGQRPIQSIENKWVSDLVSYRDSQNLPLSRNSRLDSLAKERFFMICNSISKNKLPVAEFHSRFGVGNHGIPELGIPSFSDYASTKIENSSLQEICNYVPSFGVKDDKSMLERSNSFGGIFGQYKRSKYHWEIVSGRIPVIERVKKYKSGKQEIIEREVILSNERFGSYTGVFVYEESSRGENVKVTVVFNVSIFE